MGGGNGKQRQRMQEEAIAGDQKGRVSGLCFSLLRQHLVILRNSLQLIRLCCGDIFCPDTAILSLYA